MAYSAAFEAAVDLVLALEGGWVNNEKDPGGETNFGISKRAHPNVDIRNLTREGAKAIYHAHYWMPVGADLLEPPLALCVFDLAVNSGVKRATDFLKLTNDYVLYCAERQRYYTELPGWPTFGKGWSRRLAHVLRTARGLDSGGATASRVEVLDDGVVVGSYEVPPGRSLKINMTR